MFFCSENSMFLSLQSDIFVLEMSDVFSLLKLVVFSSIDDKLCRSTTLDQTEISKQLSDDLQTFMFPRRWILLILPRGQADCIKCLDFGLLVGQNKTEFTIMSKTEKNIFTHLRMEKNERLINYEISRWLVLIEWSLI